MQNYIGKIFRGGWLILLISMLATACNSDEETTTSDDGYVMPSDVAVTAFKIKSNVNVLKGLDSVYFSIDLDKAVIYNADSLPKGTDVTKLVPEITYSQHITAATIEMTGGKVRTGTVDYYRMPGDSIDFSGRVVLTITSTQGNSRSYELKVNVHEMEPDQLSWGETAMATLPSRKRQPKTQRTVQQQGKVVSVLQEIDNTYTLATTEHPSEANWQKTIITFPETPDVRSLTACGNELYMRSSSGALMHSTDGKQWSLTGSQCAGIIGSYGAKLLLLKQNGDSYAIANYPSDGKETALTGAMADFPIADASNLYTYQSKWMAEPMALLFGGVTQRGELSSNVWGYDGKSWVIVSSDQLPALRGATLVPYFTFLKANGVWAYNEFATLLVVGGLSEGGEFNRELYYSYNNGVKFSVGSELMAMPEVIPGMWGIDGIVADTSKNAPLVPAGWQKMADKQLPAWYRVTWHTEGEDIYWQCPYIYLFGGMTADGELYDTIWRGVLNRLTFAPII